MNNIKKLTLIVLLLFGNLFSYDIEVEKQKMERQIADKISSEIRRNFFDIRFLVNVEITLEEATEEEKDSELPQDLMLPGVTGFPSAGSEKEKQQLKIASIKTVVLVENKITGEDQNLIREIAINAGKLKTGRGDNVEIQPMSFPEIKTKQNDEFQTQLDYIQKGFLLLDKMRSEQQVNQVEDLRKQTEDLRKQSSYLQTGMTSRDSIIITENIRKLNNLEIQLTKADSIIRSKQDERIKNLEASVQGKGVDPIVWGLVGLSVVLLLILLILLFALLSKKKREESQIGEYQNQFEVGQQQGALPGSEESDQPQLLEAAINEKSETADYNNLKNNLMATIAGESNNVAIILKEMMQDAAQKEKLQLVVNEFGNVLVTVLKEYFNLDELKTIQEYSLEKIDKSISEKKDVLVNLQTQINLKRFAEERNAKQNPFAFLEKLSEPQLYLLMKDETPGIIAIIISQLPSTISSALLKGLPSSQQGEVAVELGKLRRMTSDTYVSVAKKLATKASTIPVINNVQLQGSDMLLEIFDNLDESSEENIIEFIKTVNLDLYKEISSQRVGFAAIHYLDDKLLRQLIKDIDNEEMAIALKNAPAEVTDKFYSILPTKQKTMLEDRIAGIKKISADEELKARRRITRMVRSYVKSGLGSLEGLQQVEETLTPTEIEPTTEIVEDISEEKKEENQ